MEILGSCYGTISFMDYDSKAFCVDKYRNVKNLIIYGIDSIDLVNDESPHDEMRANIERLTSIVFNFLTSEDEDDDDAEGDCFLLLDEIEKLKTILAYKYQSILDLERYREYADQLYFLDREVNRKLSFLNYKQSMMYDSYVGRRGK